MWRKQNLTSVLGIQKGNWGKPHIFQRQLSLNLEKNVIHCLIFWSLLQILLINYLPKMRGYPQFSFWISIPLSRIVSKPRKNTFELVGTVLNFLSENSRELWILHKKCRNFFSFVKLKKVCNILDECTNWNVSQSFQSVKNYRGD